MNDQELIRLAKMGDIEAQSEIFEKYRAMAFRVAWRVLQNREDAMDVVQETFVKVFRGLDRFEGRSSLKTWIARIAANTALDVGRFKSVRPDIGAGAPREEFTPASSQSPVAEAQTRELAEALKECLGALPEQLAAVMALFSDAGLPYAQIAESLDIAQGTVMSRLYYAREKLRDCLKSKGFNILAERGESRN